MAKEQRYIATVDVDTDREDLGVQKIAFTANPAIVIKGVAFAAEKPESEKAKDSILMRIAAPVLVPAEIYRKSDGGHTLVFTEEEIAGIQSEFMKRLNNANPLFKNEHKDKGSSPAYILETWIVQEADTDKANVVYSLGVPVGSWIVIIQITDRAYYDSLVKDGATGLSIEGFLGHKLELSTEVKSGGMKIIKKQDGVELSTVEQVSKWEIDVDNVEFNEGDVVTSTNEEGKTRQIGSGEYILPDGRSVVTDSDGIIQKIKEVKMAGEGEGVKSSLPDGEYKGKDGTLVIKDGVVVVPGKEEELDDTEGEGVEMKEEELLDGKRLFVDSKGDTTAKGDKVYLIEGEIAPKTPAEMLVAPDGSYKLKSGAVMVVKDGAVDEIKDADPEELEAVVPEGGAAIDAYTKTEVDAKIEEMRAEFAEKLAALEIAMEQKEKIEEEGESVTMSAEERTVNNLNTLRNFFTGQGR